MEKRKNKERQKEMVNKKTERGPVPFLRKILAVQVSCCLSNTVLSEEEIKTKKSKKKQNERKK